MTVVAVIPFPYLIGSIVVCSMIPKQSFDGKNVKCSVRATLLFSF